LIRMQKDATDYLAINILRIREEIQKTFAQSQEYVAKTHKLKEECTKILQHTDTSP
jgi:hypothetical protein